MEAKAVPHMQGKHRRSIALGLSLALFSLLSGLLLVGPAAAAVPGKNGEIRACYKVRGKAKGSMRVVAGKQCRRGERKLSWSVVGFPSSQGTSGAPGNSGSPGTSGSGGDAGGASGSTATTAALETKVAALTLKVETLEDTLAGVTNGDLTGAVGKLSGVTGPQLNEAVGKLSGVTGPQLNEAVGAVPLVGSLCTQATALPTQVNDSLGDALSGLSLGGTIPPLLNLTVPSLTQVPAFTCPS